MQIKSLIDLSHKKFHKIILAKEMEYEYKRKT